MYWIYTCSVTLQPAKTEERRLGVAEDAQREPCWEPGVRRKKSSTSHFCWQSRGRNDPTRALGRTWEVVPQHTTTSLRLKPPTWDLGSREVVNVQQGRVRGVHVMCLFSDSAMTSGLVITL